MADYTWSGATSNLTDVDANWVGGTKPPPGSGWILPASPTTKRISNNFAADYAVESIAVNGTGYTLAGNRITLGAGGIVQTTGVTAISLAIVLGTAVTIDVSGSTHLSLSGVISETGGARSISKTGTSQLRLSGVNTWSGGIIVKAGSLRGGTRNAAFGTGTITLGGSEPVELLNFSRTFANPIVLTDRTLATKRIAISSYGTAGTFTGGITGNNDFSVVAAESATTTFTTTPINHTGTITNSGTGTGATTISAVIGTNVTGITQASATSNLILSGAGTIANCSDKLAITSGQLQLSTANTVANLFVDATGCTDKTAQLILAANQTVTGEFKPRGVAACQLLVTSDTLGTARTITVTGATLSNMSNVDWRDITFNNGGTDVNLSTYKTGDCGGNTITSGVLSFTTPVDWRWHSAGPGTYNISDRTYLFTETNGGGTQMAADRGPLPQDNVYCDGDSINGTTTIDQDLPRMPGIDFTGCDPVAFHVNNVQQICYGSFIGAANVTYTGSASYTLTFGTRGSVSLNPVSQLTDNITIAVVGGTVTLGGNIDNGTGATITLSNGTLDGDTYNVSCLTFVASGTLARTLLMGSGTWNVHVWTFTTTTNLTSASVGETSTIVFGSATDSTARTFAGGGLTYNNLSIVANTTGTQQVTISGNNTFTGTVTINGPKTINFTAGTTQTVASLATTGTGIVLKSTVPGSPWYLVDASGTNQVSNATISDSHPSGGALWLASDGTNTDGGGNLAYDPATNAGWKWTGFAPWIKRRIRRMAGAR